MHSLITNFNGSSNLGLFVYLNDKYMLLGNEVSEEQEKLLSKVFRVPIHRITIAGTSLIGVFLAGNDNKILVPSIIFEEEKSLLKKIGIEFEVLDTKLTCLGNNLLITETKIIANPEYSKTQLKQIEEFFNIKTEPMKIAGIGTIGSLFAINNKRSKALVTNDISEIQLDKLEKELNLNITTSSVNMGSPYLKSGIICNNNGFAIGELSGAPEITTADEGLGFINN